MTAVSVECLYAVCVGVGLLFGSLWQDYEETIPQNKVGSMVCRVSLADQPDIKYASFVYPPGQLTLSNRVNG